MTAGTAPDPRVGPAVRVRPVVGTDLPALLAANQAEVPAVGPLDEDRLAALVDLARPGLVAEVDGALAGFVLALPPGTGYASPNYRWVSAHYDDFCYVDRIVVLPHASRRGVGRRLYDAVAARTGAPVLVAEVNTRPRNDPSLAFHARYGFVRVGTGRPYDDDTEVAYLAHRLPAPS